MKFDDDVELNECGARTTLEGQFLLRYGRSHSPVTLRNRRKKERSTVKLPVRQIFDSKEQQR